MNADPLAPDLTPRPTIAFAPRYRPADRLAALRPHLGAILAAPHPWASDLLLLLADAHDEAAEAHLRAQEIAREKGEHIPALALAAADCRRAADALRALAPWFAPGPAAPCPPAISPSAWKIARDAARGGAR